MSLNNLVILHKNNVFEQNDDELNINFRRNGNQG